MATPGAFAQSPSREHTSTAEHRQARAPETKQDRAALTRSAALKHAAERFDAADADKDGVLTREERRAHKALRQQRREKREALLRTDARATAQAESDDGKQ